MNPSYQLKLKSTSFCFVFCRPYFLHIDMLGTSRLVLMHLEVLGYQIQSHTIDTLGF